MENVSQCSDIAFLVFIELTIACAHMNRLFIFASTQSSSARRPFYLFNIFHLCTTTTKGWNATAVRIHLGALLFNKYFQCHNISCFLNLGLFLQFSLLISQCVISDPLIFTIFNHFQIIAIHCLGLILVYCVEILVLAESLKHRKLKSCVETTILTFELGFVTKSLPLQLKLVNPLINLQ